MADNANNPQLNELVSFIQHDLPGLEAGKYKLKIDQEIKNKEGKVVSDQSLSANYNFAVAGDRFSLSKPAESIYSLFPADKATGRYDTVLPSVVFNKTTFPWSRSPLKGGKDTKVLKAAPGADVDADVPTWLGIILLDEDDISKYTTAEKPFTGIPVVAQIKDLFAEDIFKDSTLKKNYSYFYEATPENPKDPATLLDPGQTTTDAIQVLDIPVALFQSIAPSIEDLKLMAHVRKVSLLNKPTMPGISDIGEPVGSFSIVFGNRLPGPKKKANAYLVSFEGLEDFLPDSGKPTGKAGFVPDPTKTLRLAVLNSWIFYTTGDNAAFVDQLKALNGAPITEEHVVNKDLKLNTNLRLNPAPNALPIVASALNMGYVPINHNLRTGKKQDGVFKADKTVSWYRGPLVPYLLDKRALKIPVASPDQILIFDPSTGLLDTSYAAAWTLGRQMALQDKSFSTSLYNWKKGLSLDVLNNIEQKILTKQFSNVFNRMTPNLKKLHANDLHASGRNRVPGSFIKNIILSLPTKNK